MMSNTMAAETSQSITEELYSNSDNTTHTMSSNISHSTGDALHSPVNTVHVNGDAFHSIGKDVAQRNGSDVVAGGKVRLKSSPVIRLEAISRTEFVCITSLVFMATVFLVVLLLVMPSWMLLESHYPVTMCTPDDVAAFGMSLGKQMSCVYVCDATAIYSQLLKANMDNDTLCGKDGDVLELDSNTTLVCAYDNLYQGVNESMIDMNNSTNLTTVLLSTYTDYQPINGDFDVLMYISRPPSENWDGQPYTLHLNFTVILQGQQIAEQNTILNSIVSHAGDLECGWVGSVCEVSLLTASELGRDDCADLFEFESITVQVLFHQWFSPFSATLNMATTNSVNNTIADSKNTTTTTTTTTTQLKANSGTSEHGSSVSVVYITVSDAFLWCIFGTHVLLGGGMVVYTVVFIRMTYAHTQLPFSEWIVERKWAVCQCVAAIIVASDPVYYMAVSNIIYTSTAALTTLIATDELIVNLSVGVIFFVNLLFMHSFYMEGHVSMGSWRFYLSKIVFLCVWVAVVLLLFSFEFMELFDKASYQAIGRMDTAGFVLSITLVSFYFGRMMWVGHLNVRRFRGEWSLYVRHRQIGVRVMILYQSMVYVIWILEGSVLPNVWLNRLRVDRYDSYTGFSTLFVRSFATNVLVVLTVVSTTYGYLPPSKEQLDVAVTEVSILNRSSHVRGVFSLYTAHWMRAGSRFAYKHTTVGVQRQSACGTPYHQISAPGLCKSDGGESKGDGRLCSESHSTTERNPSGEIVLNSVYTAGMTGDVDPEHETGRGFLGRECVNRDTQVVSPRRMARQGYVGVVSRAVCVGAVSSVRRTQTCCAQEGVCLRDDVCCAHAAVNCSVRGSGRRNSIHTASDRQSHTGDPCTRDRGCGLLGGRLVSGSHLPHTHGVFGRSSAQHCAETSEGIAAYALGQEVGNPYQGQEVGSPCQVQAVGSPYSGRRPMPSVSNNACPEPHMKTLGIGKVSQAEREGMQTFKTAFEGNNTDYHVIEHVEDAATDTHFLVFTQDDNLVISFRGTKSKDNAVTDLRASLVPTCTDLTRASRRSRHSCATQSDCRTENVLVHQGFMMAFASIRERLFACMRQQIERAQDLQGPGANVCAQCSVLRTAGRETTGDASTKPLRDADPHLASDGDHMPDLASEVVSNRHRTSPHRESPCTIPSHTSGIGCGEISGKRPAPLHTFITGHSLGGALATLCAFELAQEFATSELELTVYTFGSPRVGNSRFAAQYNQLVPNTHRLVNDGDPVCGLPKFMAPQFLNITYKHVGTCYVIAERGDMIINPCFPERMFQLRSKRIPSQHTIGSYRTGILRCLKTMTRRLLAQQKGQPLEAEAEASYELGTALQVFTSVLSAPSEMYTYDNEAGAADDGLHQYAKDPSQAGPASVRYLKDVAQMSLNDSMALNSRKSRRKPRRGSSASVHEDTRQQKGGKVLHRTPTIPPAARPSSSTVQLSHLKHLKRALSTRDMHHRDASLIKPIADARETTRFDAPWEDHSVATAPSVPAYDIETGGKEKAEEKIL
ncbi:hypothetical protein SARC_02958 [Sphaeroforma arctica JP610]|uniref:Fungal lipase-type domain-containing protein n=1 Tax=Sphaeroforma arctica JP610 TaxID=667725 RepID=A0A0L0G733_9EUKA|nr:hypothetical protein SARC_02958 [Sphaeroforma arctica JP610]KNC84847.1 hypothetical protein SARC_02958 [Sphaeroforma arctica JP610]|eukprot:XP_014158749.1 hypothetical protein SARC_02958 [Sphaeroforma arctica JP610]